MSASVAVSGGIGPYRRLHTEREVREELREILAEEGLLWATGGWPWLALAGWRWCAGAGVAAVRKR